ncbi:Gfo/Idh/MocA family protein [uncultured Mitsuokella sp.]|uniref:Gfo/Idh/MocA family protein n=1 Tax=uncultured Mitsuokella sp. TaxID=453120 RepID=UPI0026034501|nr:Gfo/Idh/MocA family oxidoreductase [uncultured Mitsuokella sp.]
MVKIALLGAGKIVQEALTALREVPQMEAVAIFTRPQSRAKAEKLAAKWHIPRIYTDYEAMLTAEDADFFYVGLANHVHYAYARRALQHGRHVIMEKPFAPTAAEIRELADLAREKGLYLIEAVTPFFLPNYEVVREALPHLGRIRAVQANYSQYSSRYDRYLAGEVLPVFDPGMCGGALYDINIYNINLLAGLFGRPQAMHYMANTGYNGIDTSGVAVLRYEDFFATAVGAKDSASPGFFLVQGETGWLRVDGAPNEMPAVTLSYGGRTWQVQKNRYAHRMVHEFQRMAEIYESHDLAAVQRGLSRSVLVGEIVDGLRQSAAMSQP